MKRIGITQRRDQVLNRNETRDALDVCWASLLWDLNLVAIPLCSDIESRKMYLETLGLDGFILSGGNDIGESCERDSLESCVLEFSKCNDLPVLGVCRGMQYINYFQGGSLAKVDGHVATQHALVGNWADHFGIRHVNSFHDYALLDNSLGEDLYALAHSEDGVIEAFRHTKHRWLGIMWHPERNSDTKQSCSFIQAHFGG